MRIDLTDTNSSAIASALLDARRRSGSPTVGMVLTLVIDTTEDDHADALRAATEAAREHPCRILTVIRHSGRDKARLDAELSVGGEAGLLESVILRLAGKLGRHADSVVLPLLLPDTPVVVWWPGNAPADVANTVLGQLAKRRVTDAAAGARSTKLLPQRAEEYQPGDTDFAWTRLTPWRTLLASELDQNPGRIRSATVHAARGNPSGELLVTWLSKQLRVRVDQVASRGPGITAVTLDVPGGQIAVHRPDGRLATLSRPGDPDRQVALARREISELLAEELRRLDPDEPYHETLAHHAKRLAKQSKG
ncbi:MAG: glucose-6-phosphate dehydrogenase assembly protein OpcA [Streptosporangiales bacterium]|nr:glucose-6-phosphate dehydrogenase assembly protein OpcA [Streptosporangiales bacterium]